MKLSREDVDARLLKMPGWSFERDSLVRSFKFPSFPDAVAFVTRLGFHAEDADHHPDLTLSYRQVTVTWSTHSDGGVTAKDFDGARVTDEIAARLGGVHA